MGHRIAAIDRAAIREAALLKDRGQKIGIGRRARDMGFGLRPHRRGQWCRIVAEPQIRRNAQVEGDDRFGLGRRRAAAGALTRSPPRSSSMSAPEERRSSGTVCNAAGQLLRSGAGMETPGTDEAVVVRQQKIAPSNTTRSRGRESSFSILGNLRGDEPRDKGPDADDSRPAPSVQVVNFHQADSGPAIFAAFDRGVGAGREGYQDRRFGVI